MFVCVLLYFVLSPMLAASQPTGSIQLLVLDSLGMKPLPNILVTISTFREDKNLSRGHELDGKRTDNHGTAVFHNLTEGRYILFALKRRQSDYRLMAASVIAMVEAGKTTHVKILFHPQGGDVFPDEPRYRMPFMRPDTTRDERMPIYRPNYPKYPPPDYPPVKRDSIHP